ncbi:hypothetical protein PFMALIP_01934 [Plasmodium falciparum MaliPS096_E11]|uniref:Uncharacterized protein n=1 Tax=Plasmodium falciparum MaliPS096_E11 TaxID=1036727 RepID=A0A024WTM5_PLAFA|nr:hypothetical protein PFMALIP_01934 [Plasmodium falciparum MaliPS096_E11]
MSKKSNNTEDNNNSKKSQPTIKCITKCGTHTSNSNIKKEKKKKRFNIFSAIAKKFFLSALLEMNRFLIRPFIELRTLRIILYSNHQQYYS